VTLALGGLGTSSMNGVPVPYVANWSGQASNASAAFTFDESCAPGQPGPTPPVTGTATGSFGVSGGQVSIAGGPWVAASLSGNLDWRRVGSAARLTLSSLTITASSGGTTIAVNLISVLVGESPTAFVWTNGPGTCGTTQVNQTALIEGVALMPA
jgi:hypothetical protein